MQPQAYFHSDTYHDALDALERVVTSYGPDSAYDVSMLRTRLILALGETLGAWPASVYQGEDDPNCLSVFVMAKINKNNSLYES